jgi:hypothetical protein
MAVPALAPSSSTTAASAAAVPGERLGRAIVRLGLRGAAQGALLYGGAIALLHVTHDRVGMTDALVLLAWSLALYGLWAGVAAAATAAAWRVAVAAVAGLRGRARRRAQENEASPATSAEPRATRDLWLATAPFHVVFWVLALNYGLTYDESPGWVAAAPQMALWLALRALGTAALSLAAGWALARLTTLAARLVGLPKLASGAALGLAIASVALALARPAPAAPPATPPPAAAAAPAGAAPVALVAVDGADWRVIEPLVAAGRLPNFARLMAEGAWGPLATLPDSNSAVIWASIYTGRAPEDHHVLDFYTVRLPGMQRGVYPVHRTFFKELVLRLQGMGMGEIVPIDRGNVAKPLLWEVAQAGGRSIGLVDGYYYSYPAPAAVGEDSWYVAYGADAIWQQERGRAGGPHRRVAARYAAPPELIGELGPLLEGADFEWQSSSLLQLLPRRGQPDLVTFYTHEPDSLQHGHWRSLEPERYFGGRGVVADNPIVAFHLALDAFLGRLREHLGPETVLIVASDHGHSPTIAHSMETQHRHGPPGIVVLHGPSVQPGRLTGAHVYDLFPTALHLIGVPVPDDGAGKVLTAALRPDAASRPIARVPTWDALPPPTPATAVAGSDRRDDELDKLRGNGYLQ